MLIADLAGPLVVTGAFLIPLQKGSRKVAVDHAARQVKRRIEGGKKKLPMRRKAILNTVREKTRRDAYHLLFLLTYLLNLQIMCENDQR